MKALQGQRRAIALTAAITAAVLIALFETHHQVPGFRACSFVASFVLAAAIAVMLPGRARNVAVAAAAVLFGLAVLEITALAVAPRKGTLTITPRWLVLKPAVGFGFDQAMVVHSRKTDAAGHVIFDAHYTIGPDFDRQVRSAPNGPATVFLGDSFTFGEGLDDDETLPQRYAELRPGQRVINLAITGYSPQQFLREMETGLRDAAIGRQPRAFVFLTSPFHAARTSCKEPWTNNAPLYERKGDALAYAGPCYSGVALAWQEFRMNTAFYRLAIRPFVSRLTHDDVALYVDELARAVTLARERYGAPTLVPFVRVGDAYLHGTGWTDASVIAALQARGVWVVDMSLPTDPAAGYSIRGDDHPTGAANRIRAERIAVLLDSATTPQSVAGPP